MALNSKKKVIGVKIETTQGTAVSLGATDFIEAYEIEAAPDAELLPRTPHSQSLDTYPHLVGKKWQEIKFKVDLKGSAAAGTAYAPLGAILQSAGLVETVVATEGVQSVAVTAGGSGYTSASALTFSGGAGTGAAGFPIIVAGAIVAIIITHPGSGYTTDPTPAVSVGTGATFTVTRGGAVLYAPTSSAASGSFYGPGKSSTIKLYEEGVLKVLAGCVGDVKTVLEAGKTAQLEVTMKGVYAALTDAAYPTNTPHDDDPPVVASANLYMHGFAPVASKLELAFNNQISERPDVRSANSLLGFQITDRNPSGSFDPESELVATHDFYGKFIAGTAAVGSIQVGTVSGNRCVIGLRNVQYGKPSPSDRNGISAFNTPLMFRRSSGDDWATFLFS